MSIAAATISNALYTVEAYFELEKTTDIRHEFVNGKIFPMPGESRIANRIADNCGFALRLHLHAKGYDIVRHDVRTVIKKGKNYRYPDVSITKITDNIDSHGVLEPELLIEVTSVNSTQTDHTEKVKQYTSLASLQYYMIISQEEPLVELYSRDAKGWRYDIFDEMSQNITLPSLNTVLTMKTIYENVRFGEAKSDV